MVGCFLLFLKEVINVTDIYLLIFLITILGVFIFSIFGLISILKKEPANEEWQKVVLFIIIGIVSFILFGLSL